MPDLVNKVGKDMAYCFYKPAFLFYGTWQQLSVFYCKDTHERTSTTASECGKYDGIRVFEARENLSRGITGNVPFTVINFYNLNINLPSILITLILVYPNKANAWKTQYISAFSDGSCKAGL